MAAPLHRLFSQTAIYGGSTMLVRLLNYLLVPFYTYVLKDPSQYGLLSELYSYVALLNILYLYGMETTYFRYAGRGGQPESRLFGQLLGLLLCTSLFFSGFLYGFSDNIAKALGYATEEGRLLRLLACILVLDACVALPFARLRLQERVWTFAGLRCMGVGLNVGLNVFFLWVCPQLASGYWGAGGQAVVQSFYVAGVPLEYILWANLLSNIIWVPLLYKHWRGLRLDLRGIGPWLRYGLPLMGMGLATMAIESLPRVLFRHLYAPEAQESALRALGSYAACAKLAVIMLLATQAYRYAAEPFMLSSYQGQTHRRQLAEATHWFLRIGSWLLVGISLHLDLLAALFLQHPAYRGALEVVPVLLCAYLCMGLYYNFNIWCKRIEKTHYSLYMALGGLLLTLCINIFGVLRFGYGAMAWALLLSYALMAGICYVWGQHRYFIPYRLGGALGQVGIGLGLVGVASPAFSWVQDWNPSWPWGTATGLWIMYTLFLGISIRKEIPWIRILLRRS